MYQLYKETISGQKIYTIRNKTSDCIFSLAPSLGAALFRLKLSDKDTSTEILQPWVTEGALVDYYLSSYSGSQLFPFPNRVQNGKYAIDNQEINFPLNDFGRPNALHGQLYNKAFSMSAWEPEKGDIKLSYRHQPDAVFPYAYDIMNHFQLRPDRLTILTKITNLSQTTIPYGYGWHPYFSAGISPESTIDKHILELDTTASYLVDKNLIPTGKTSPFSHFNNGIMINQIDLDTCFQKGPSNHTKLTNPDKNYCVELNTEGFEYIQLYIPDDRKSIAIEPQTCIPDAMNNGIGLLHLKPQNTVTYKFQIRLISTI